MPTRVAVLSKASSMSICVCMCESVDPHDITKMAETTIAELSKGIILRHSWLLIYY